MDILRSILLGLLLGVVQGVTEWLPISSSGHLVVVQVGIGYEPPLLFDGLLHVASAAVVWFTFRRDLIKYLRAWLLGWVDWKSKGFFDAFGRLEAKMGWFVILAIIPTFLIGFFFYQPLKDLFGSLTAAGIAALVSTGVLVCSYFFKNGVDRRMSVPRALLVGLAQGCAIVPGISRSGSTITMGMVTGLNRETAARFSFILSIPSLVGATAFVLLRNWGQFDLDPVTTVVGVVTVMITGYLSIRILLYIVKKWGLHYFAVYTLVFGIGFTIIGLYFGI